MADDQRNICPSFFVTAHWMQRLICGVGLSFGSRPEEEGWRSGTFKSVVRETKPSCSLWKLDKMDFSNSLRKHFYRLCRERGCYIDIASCSEEYQLLSFVPEDAITNGNLCTCRKLKLKTLKRDSVALIYYGGKQVALFCSWQMLPMVYKKMIKSHLLIFVLLFFAFNALCLIHYSYWQNSFKELAILVNMINTVSVHLVECMQGFWITQVFFFLELLGWWTSYLLISL